MAGVDFDAGQVDLPRAVVDVQHADISLPGGDDLPPVRVEGALMKGTLDLFVPPPDRRDVVAHGGLVQLVAELGVGGGSRAQRDDGRAAAGVLHSRSLPQGATRVTPGPRTDRICPGGPRGACGFPGATAPARAVPRSSVRRPRGASADRQGDGDSREDLQSSVARPLMTCYRRLQFESDR